MTSADLTGRSGGYRGVAIRCPGCAESMRQVLLAEADSEVDVCDGCGGLWVDWFDGEVRVIAAETLRTGDVPSSKAKEAGDGTSPSRRNEAVAVGACPRCTRQLVPERYTVKAEVTSPRIDGRTSLVSTATGAELLRCEDCMGAFVSRASAEVLTWLSSTSDGPPSSQSTATLKPVPWTSFVGLLKRFLGLKR